LSVCANIYIEIDVYTSMLSFLFFHSILLFGYNFNKSLTYVLLAYLFIVIGL